MQVSPRISRSIALAATVVLALDGVALLGLGLWSHRAMLTLGGSFFLFSAVLAMLSWRWYRRRLADIRAAKRALREDATDIQRVLRRK